MGCIDGRNVGRLVVELTVGFDGLLLEFETSQLNRAFSRHAGLGQELGSLVGEIVGTNVGWLDGLAVMGCIDGDAVG